MPKIGKIVVAAAFALLAFAPANDVDARGGGLSLRKLSTQLMSGFSNSGTSTFSTSGAGQSFVVPTYNTLTIEIYGAGASGNGNVPGSSNVASVAGGASSIVAPALTVPGGPGGSVALTGGTGASAPTGFDVNTAGNSAASGGATGSAGANGPAPASAAGGSAAPSGGACTGGTGVQPGAAGGGSFNSGSGSPGYAGGGSGAYGKITYTYGVTPGFPVVGTTLSLTVGLGGSMSTSCNGGIGANGQIKFTWN